MNLPYFLLPTLIIPLFKFVCTLLKRILEDSLPKLRIFEKYRIWIVPDTFRGWYSYLRTSQPQEEDAVRRVARNGDSAIY